MWATSMRRAVPAPLQSIPGCRASSGYHGESRTAAHCTPHHARSLYMPHALEPRLLHHWHFFSIAPQHVCGARLAAILLHFINGSVTFPLSYAYLAFRFLPGQPWLRGVLWGFVLWGLVELLVMPLMGAGLFSADSGRVAIAAAIVLLFGHLAYGTLLGLVAGGTTERSERLPEATTSACQSWSA